MELVQGHLPEQRLARKVLLLQDCQSEVLVLTSPHLAELWSPTLTEALKHCALRGLRVRILLERGVAPPGLSAAGIEIHQARGTFGWARRPFPLQSELWIFDRSEAIAVNERIFTGAASRERAPQPLHVECLMGENAARGMSAYFDRRWEGVAQLLEYSVRHKDYAFHSGRRADLQFFGCMMSAQREITLSVPGGRVSRAVEGALHQALQHGLRVTIFTNADRDDAPALRRLRRLAVAGSAVKICGRRLTSECAVIDGHSIYMGPLPSSWYRWAQSPCPVFVMDDLRMGQDLLAALDRQVSVEVSASSTA